MSQQYDGLGELSRAVGLYVPVFRCREVIVRRSVSRVGGHVVTPLVCKAVRNEFAYTVVAAAVIANINDDAFRILERIQDLVDGRPTLIEKSKSAEVEVPNVVAHPSISKDIARAGFVLLFEVLLFDEIQGEILHFHLAENPGSKPSLPGLNTHVVIVQMAEELGHDVKKLVVRRLGCHLWPIDLMESVPVDFLGGKDAVVPVVGLPEVFKVLLWLVRFLGAEGRARQQNREQGQDRFVHRMKLLIPR